jgi:hypothetical protein
VTEPYKHPLWQRKRLDIMKRDGFRCVACDNDQITLHVHHKSYHGMAWESPDDQLQTLCEPCHSKLGEHPKGGVWWVRDNETFEGWGGPSSSVRVWVEWCPRCGSSDFKDKGSWAKCRNCAWDCGSYDAFALSSSINLNDPPPVEEKKKEYSASWLKGLMTRLRNSGMADVEIFDALFHESQAAESVRVLRECVKEMDSLAKSIDIDDSRYLELCKAAIDARRVIRNAIGCLGGKEVT